MRISKATALLGLCAFAGATAYAGRAAAEDCSTRRPTDPSGFAGYSYGASEVKYPWGTTKRYHVYDAPWAGNAAKIWFLSVPVTTRRCWGANN